MGYDRAELVSRLKAALAKEPTRSLKSIADELNVGRHTITRVLRLLEGVTFEQLRLRTIADALDRIRANSRPLTGKEIAARLGFSCQRRLGACLRRLPAAGNLDGADHLGQPLRRVAKSARSVLSSAFGAREEDRRTRAPRP